MPFEKMQQTISPKYSTHSSCTVPGHKKENNGTKTNKFPHTNQEDKSKVPNSDNDKQNIEFNSNIH